MEKKNYIKEGMKFGLGFLIGISFLLLGYSAGWHISEEVQSGEFVGSFSFNGSTNFSNSQVYISKKLASCNSVNEGAIYFNDTSKSLMTCNSTHWVTN